MNNNNNNNRGAIRVNPNGGQAAALARVPINFAAPQPQVRIPLPGAPPPPPVANIYADNDSDDDDDDDFGPLNIHIIAPTIILGHNNICSVDPANIAARVSASIASAISRLGGGAVDGIPMIDGEGNPRKIQVDVDVATRIEGDGNLVGDAAVVGRIGGVVEQAGRVDGQHAMEEGVLVDNDDQERENENHRAAERRPAAPPIVKREPLEEMPGLNATPRVPGAATSHNKTPREASQRSSRKTYSGSGSSIPEDESKKTPKLGGKRKSARITRDDDVASNAGLGIGRQAQDHAAKRPRRG